MNRPPVGGESSDRGEMPYRTSVEIEFVAPLRQQGFVVTRQQWNRIKENVRNIRSRESQWISAFYALLSIGISFLIGTLSLAQFEGVALWVTIAFYMAVAIGFSGAIICLIAYRESKKHREDDINIALEYMDDIERIYEG